MDFNNGDLVEIDLKVQAVMVWMQIPDDVDDNGNPVSTKGAWVCQVIPQQIIYSGQEFQYLGSTVVQMPPYIGNDVGYSSTAPILQATSPLDKTHSDQDQQSHS